MFGRKKKKEKEYLLGASDIRPLLATKMGCIATDRITVEGRKVGFFYREEPSEGLPDTGWRFFAGDESDEYLDDPDNSNVFCLNTIANYDRDIIPYLDSEIGSAYYRDPRTGKFVLDREWMAANRR